MEIEQAVMMKMIFVYLDTFVMEQNVHHVQLYVMNVLVHIQINV